MAFKKGESGNPDGRPKGAVNKSGKELREAITNFLTENFDTIRKDFEQLPPIDRYRLYCHLLRYSLPQLQSVSIETQIERLREEDLDEILERIKSVQP